MTKLAVDVGPEDHVRGAKKPSVTLVEYGDYQCPSCAEAALIVQRIEKHFGGKLRFCFRNFPLPQHALAETAAETAEFAGSEGKFWEMHDALFRNQTEFEEELFPELAKQLGLEFTALDEALETGTFAGRVEQDVASGEKSGVQGTPTFYINGRRYDGSFAYEDLVKAIDGAMA